MKLIKSKMKFKNKLWISIKNPYICKTKERIKDI